MAEGMDTASLTERERIELTRLMFQSAKCSGAARDILACVDEGVLPPPESIEWFISRFRHEKESRE